MDNVIGHANIAKHFAGKFCDKSVSFDMNEMTKLKSEIDGLLSTKCSKTDGCVHGVHVFTSDDVVTGIKSWK